MELIVVDTSIWIDEIREPGGTLSSLISESRCLMHPLVLTEIALGKLARWSDQVVRFQLMPQATWVELPEVLDLIASRSLQGSGLGATDLNLLASTLATPDCRLWTRDRRLRQQAEAVGVAWSPPA